MCEKDCCFKQKDKKVQKDQDIKPADFVWAIKRLKELQEKYEHIKQA